MDVSRPHIPRRCAGFFLPARFKNEKPTRSPGAVSRVPTLKIISSGLVVVLVMLGMFDHFDMLDVFALSGLRR